MMIDTEYPNGCSEEFAELCALSTSNELSDEELAMLHGHVANCASCAALLGEYTALASVGFAKMAASLNSDTEIEIPRNYDEVEAEKLFVTAFRALRPDRYSGLPADISQVTAVDRWNRIRRPALLIGAVAALLICVVGAYRFGRSTTSISTPSAFAKAVDPPLTPDAEKTELRMKLATVQTSLKATTEESADLKKQLTDLSNAKSSLLARIDELTKKSNADLDSLTVAIQQRDALQQQLNDTSSALVRAREDLNRAQQDRQGELYRVASLESEIRNLHIEAASRGNSTESDEKLFAADRDIRELMGARQLYISDVFDVQKNGERSKPFGRVFYTKGKSLIFYAFDLEKQSGYREAKIFQAWGKPDSPSMNPISLGIFYMDSEQNRRWVVKSDNPAILAQINSVFVTVEPHGGSKAPTGKPFLEAYLHSLPPNHP